MHKLYDFINSKNTSNIHIYKKGDDIYLQAKELTDTTLNANIITNSSEFSISEDSIDDTYTDITPTI